MQKIGLALSGLLIASGWSQLGAQELTSRPCEETQVAIAGPVLFERQLGPLKFSLLLSQDSIYALSAGVSAHYEDGAIAGDDLRYRYDYVMVSKHETGRWIVRDGSLCLTPNDASATPVDQLAAPGCQHTLSDGSATIDFVTGKSDEDEPIARPIRLVRAKPLCEG